jgi:thiamine biosynthesis lipoprotein
MKNMYKRLMSVIILAVICIVGVIYCFGTGNNISASKSIFAMDTYMEITAYGRDSEKAVEAATAEIERLDELLSTGSGTSEVTVLNKNAGGILSDDTEYLLERSLDIYNSTYGAFDITVYPVMKEWGFTTGEFRVPDKESLSKLTEKVDASKLTYDEDTKTLTMPEGVEIDFGGIAKGYTSSRVAEIMKEYGISSAKINLGGNVQTVGKKTDGSNWRIAIKTPDESLGIEYLGIVSMADKAVITSGGYERYFEENGITYHHIIDTNTGYPADKGLISVTIVSDDGTLADGLSTALYCMGLDKATAYWQEHSDEFDMVLYDCKKGLFITQGLNDSFTSQLEYTELLLWE